MPGVRSLISLNILPEVRHNELIARIAAGFAEFLADIGQSIDTDCFRLESLDLHLLNQFGLGDQVVHGTPSDCAIFSDDRIRFRMNGGHVEGIFAAADAQKAGGLLEGLRTEAGNGGQLDARAEAAMLIAILDDLLRGAFIDSGDVAQQSPGCGIQIDANAIDAGFDRALQTLHQLLLIDIMLILAYADRLRIDLHQFGQRILQAAADGDGAADRQIEFRELLPRDIGCGVDRGAGFIHDDTERSRSPACLQEILHEAGGLARPGAIADGDGPDVVFVDEPPQALWPIRRYRSSAPADR